MFIYQNFGLTCSNSNKFSLTQQNLTSNSEIWANRCLSLPGYAHKQKLCEITELNSTSERF